jgi:glycerol uptake facilitator-like aquaporin
MEDITSPINYLLDQQIIKITLALLSATFIGYTLKPVPAWLTELFNESVVFKGVILLIFALVVSHPLNNKKLLALLVGVPVVLIIYYLLQNN